MSQKNLQLTRLQIITEGLSRAARPDLTSNGRLWLNLFLEKQYLNQDHEWLVKEVSNRIMVNGDTLPADYVRMKTMTVTSNRIPMRVIEADEYEWLRRAYGTPGQLSTGNPNVAYIDEVNNVIYFVPLPSTVIIPVYNYFYYFFPTLPDPTTSAGDSEVPAWGLSNDILIEEIYVRALNWNDDERYEREKENVKVLLNESKMNSRDLRAGSPRFKLGKCHVRKRF